MKTLAAAALFTVLAFGQGEDKTFYFTHPTSNPEMTAVVTAVRTMTDLQDLSVDVAHQAIIAHGTLEKLAATDWLFRQLDVPAVASGSAAAAEYKMFGEKREVIVVIPTLPSASAPELSAMTTAIRTVADLQRLFPYEGRNVMIGRDIPQKIAAAEWLVQQMLPHDGQVPAGDSHPYPMAPMRPDGADGSSEIRVLRMDPKTTNSELTSMVTAIRTVADIQRLFPFESGKALIMRASPARVAVAEWLVHEIAKPADAGAVHQTTMSDPIDGVPPADGVARMDGVVRLFYVGQQTDLTALTTQIRTTMDIQRIFPLIQPRAVVLRGRPDQMSSVEALVKKLAGEAR